MQAHVELRTEDGALHAVPAGGIIGRLAGAALVLPDPRVSEAHAMVSLRGGALHLLTFRGRFAAGGRTASSMELSVGQRIEFARGLAVEVVAVQLPEWVRAVRLGDGEPLPLAGVTSLVRTACGATSTRPCSGSARRSRPGASGRNLVRSDGAGKLELVLADGDRAEDRS